MVSKGKEVLDKKVKGKTLLGNQEGEYDATVVVAPSSIRLYAPPLSVERIQKYMDEHGEGKNIVKFPGAYVQLKWDIYSFVLQEVVSNGTFVSN